METDTVIQTAEEMNRLSRKLRVLFYCFCAVSRNSDGRRVIRHGYKFWISSLILLFIGLFFLLPLAASYFIVPVDDPKSADLFARAITTAIVSLFWFWMYFRTICRCGSLSWRPDGGELRMTYGYWPFQKRVRIATEGLRVRLGIHKMDRPKIGGKYGWSIVTLERQDSPDSDLVLGLMKDDRAARLLFQELFDFLGNGIDEIGEEILADVEPTSLSQNDSVAWRKFARRTLTKKVLFGHTTGRNIQIQSHSDTILLKHHGKRWVGIFILMIPGLLFLYGVIDFVSKQNIFIAVVSFINSSVCIIPGIAMFCRAEKVTLNRLNRTVTIRYGRFPFPKSVTRSADDLQVMLYRCSKEQATRCIRPGFTVLSLAEKEDASCELVLDASAKKNNVQAAFDVLSEYFGGSVVDFEYADLELADGNILHIPIDSLTGGGGAEDKEREYREISENTAVFGYKKSFFWLGVLCGFVITLFMAIFIAKLILTAKNSQAPLVVSILLVILCFLFGILGIGLAIYGCLSRYFAADKTHDILCRTSSPTRTLRGKKLCKLSDIAAIQICMVVGTIQRNSQRDVTVYEINAVLRNPANWRIHLSTLRDRDRARKDAEQFSRFLDVPCLSHI